MDKNKKDSSDLSSVFTHKLEIPTWAFTIIAIVLASAAVMERARTASVLLLIILALILLLIGAVLTRKPAQPNPIVISDPDAPAYQISISNLPDQIAPELLKIESREELIKNRDRDGIAEIFSIAGNLIFYNTGDEQKHPVTSFSNPVTLILSFSEQDQQSFINHQQNLRAAKITEEAKFMPVYLYQYPATEPKFQIWKPFQNYEVNFESRTITIKFQFWGDQNIGFGTRP